MSYCLCSRVVCLLTNNRDFLRRHNINCLSCTYVILVVHVFSCTQICSYWFTMSQIEDIATCTTCALGATGRQNDAQSTWQQHSLLFQCIISSKHAVVHVIMYGGIRHLLVQSAAAWPEAGAEHDAFCNMGRARDQWLARLSSVCWAELSQHDPLPVLSDCSRGWHFKKVDRRKEGITAEG
jgi:hypothetical protein